MALTLSLSKRFLHAIPYPPSTGVLCSQPSLMKPLRRNTKGQGLGGEKRVNFNLTPNFVYAQDLLQVDTWMSSARVILSYIQ